MKVNVVYQLNGDTFLRRLREERSFECVDGEERLRRLSRVEDSCSNGETRIGRAFRGFGSSSDLGLGTVDADAGRIMRSGRAAKE